jgi:hypothetical protein
VVTRNGWWVSPWWLAHANHLWLCQSGDSEYAALPSANQRESASTHRDLMYYNILCRDKSMLPLDCFDNHEFADGLRNPFVETPTSWSNAIWLSFMRGSTYLAYTLQPESLEHWQVDSLKKITEFCRAYADKIFVSRGRMVLGNPGHGEVYGFIQPGENQSWCMLRNPLPVPQRVKVDFNEMVAHEAGSVKQFYPCYDYFQPGEMTFLAHEIKIMIIDKDASEPEYTVPFMVEPGACDYDYRFPASLNFDEHIKPLVKEIYQVPQMKFTNIEKSATETGLEMFFALTAPYRVRDLHLQLRINGQNSAKVEVKTYISRYPKAEGSCYALPVTFIPDNQPGYGEARNPDSSPQGTQKFLSMVIPDGGISHYRMQLTNFDSKTMELEIWASGYEAASRNVLNRSEAPMDFKKCLPSQHPLGFPLAVKL